MVQDPKALLFFQELDAKTETGKIPWEPTREESSFAAKIGGNYSVLVLKVTVTNSWGEDSVKYEIVLKDKDGKELIRVDDEVEGVHWSELQHLHELARRRALRVDEKIDNFLGELDRL